MEHGVKQARSFGATLFCLLCSAPARNGKREKDRKKATRHLSGHDVIRLEVTCVDLAPSRGKICVAVSSLIQVKHRRLECCFYGNVENIHTGLKLLKFYLLYSQQHVLADNNVSRIVLLLLQILFSQLKARDG